MLILIIVLVALAAILLTIAIILFKRIITMKSIRHIGGNLYRVSYHANYKLDKLLAKGVKDVPGLMSFVSKEIYFGYPIKVNEQISGCTSFTAQSPTGELLVGRNFDYPKTAMILVHTKPKKGYASYSMVCLSHLDISSQSGTMPETLMGKLKALAAPFGCVDGMNEKGLHVSVLELTTKPTAQNTGKTNIVTTVAVRMLLDKCATTKEAVAMLGKYDMYSSAGSPYHFLVTDTKGDTVVIEWPDPEQEMVIVKSNYATNFQLADGENKNAGGGHDRYKTVEDTLAKSQNIMTDDEVMKLCEAVSVKGRSDWGTQWSIVYNISNFTLRICCDMDYDAVYAIE